MTNQIENKLTVQDRAQRLATLTDQALAKVAEISTTRSSAVYEALKPDADKIKAKIAEGYKPGTLARAYIESDELVETFSQESIRLAILKIIGRRPGKGTRHKPKPAPANNSGMQSPTGPNNSGGDGKTPAQRKAEYDAMVAREEQAKANRDRIEAERNASTPTSDLDDDTEPRA